MDMDETRLDRIEKKLDDVAIMGARIEERLKSSTNRIDRLEFRADEQEDDLEDVGFIAQEVEEVLPNVVHVTPGFIGDNEKVKTVSYIKIIPYLVDTIQELTKRIEELEK